LGKLVLYFAFKFLVLAIFRDETTKGVLANKKVLSSARVSETNNNKISLLLLARVEEKRKEEKKKKKRGRKKERKGKRGNNEDGEKRITFQVRALRGRSFLRIIPGLFTPHRGRGEGEKRRDEVDG